MLLILLFSDKFLSLTVKYILILIHQKCILKKQCSRALAGFITLSSAPAACFGNHKNKPSCAVRFGVFLESLTLEADILFMHLILFNKDLSVARVI
jgi:hypothetical protein